MYKLPPIAAEWTRFQLLPLHACVCTSGQRKWLKAKQHSSSQNQNFVFSVIVLRLEQTLPKLPVVLSAGAGSFLRLSALQEDTLCSEDSGENLWQHQRGACCFSNLTPNEKRPSCRSAITAASLGGWAVRNRRLWELLFNRGTAVAGDQVCQRWVTELKCFSLDFWSCEATITSCCYCKKKNPRKISQACSKITCKTTKADSFPKL